MNKKRLLMMREALEEASDIESKLDMGAWVQGNSRGLDLEYGDAVSLDQAHSCGTTCCIGGWAGTHKGLQNEGLALVIDKYSSFSLELNGTPNFNIRNHHDEYNSLEEFFGINSVQADALFNDTLDGIYDANVCGSNLESWEYRGSVVHASLDNAIVIIDKIIAEG